MLFLLSEFKIRLDIKGALSQEFSNLAADAKIYKLVGPVLLKQERSEAVLAVDGRLEFIEKEMWVDSSACSIHGEEKGLISVQQADRKADQRNAGEEREQEDGG